MRSPYCNGCRNQCVWEEPCWKCGGSGKAGFGITVGLGQSGFIPAVTENVCPVCRGYGYLNMICDYLRS